MGNRTLEKECDMLGSVGANKQPILCNTNSLGFLSNLHCNQFYISIFCKIFFIYNC